MREETSLRQRTNTLFSLADSHNRAIITNLPCRPIHITMCLLKRLISATGVKVLHTGDSRQASPSALQSFPVSSAQVRTLSYQRLWRSLALMKPACFFFSCREILIILFCFLDLSKIKQLSAPELLHQYNILEHFEVTLIVCCLLSHLYN